MTEPQPATPSGRFALVLTTVVVSSLVGGALLAPAVHSGFEALSSRPELRFSSVFARVAMACLLVGMLVMRRSLGLSRIASAWRAESWRERGTRLVVGALASLLPALLVLVPAIHHSALGWAGRTWLQAAHKIVDGVPSALAAGFVEESFFRVVVFAGLAVSWNWRVAAVLSSAFYAVVHYLAPDGTFVPDGASAVEGLRYLAASLGGLTDPASAAAVFGLTLVGIVLSVAFQRNGSLGFITGLHMGWFLAAKAAIRLSHLPPELAHDASRVKRMLLIGSPWLWLAIGVTWLAVLFLTRRHERDG